MTTIVLRNPKKGSHCYVNTENNKFFLYSWDGTLTQVGEFTDTEKAIASLLDKGWIKKED